MQQPFQNAQQIQQGIQQTLRVDTTGHVSQQGALSDVSIISHHSAMSDRSVIPNTQDPVSAANVGASQAPTVPTGDEYDGTFNSILGGF